MVLICEEDTSTRSANRTTESWSGEALLERTHSTGQHQIRMRGLDCGASGLGSSYALSRRVKQLVRKVATMPGVRPKTPGIRQAVLATSFESIIDTAA